jgi:Ca2+-binding EF-hand superfamily protein
LDLEETQKFIIDNIGKLSTDFQFNEDEIGLIFKKFDSDGSGTIDKDEMV